MLYIPISMLVAGCSSQTMLSNVHQPESGIDDGHQTHVLEENTLFPQQASTEPAQDEPPQTEETPEPPLSIYEQCFPELMDEEQHGGPDYDLLQPQIGSHCNGTNHQNIQDIERVVFLGDSVTVGTPPTPDAEFYRNLLAKELAEEFTLDSPDF